MVGSALFVPCGNASEVLQLVDHALDDVALPIGLSVEVALPTLVDLGRDHRNDAAPAQGDPQAPACCRRHNPANKWRIKTECVDQLFGLTLPSADRCRPAVGLGGRWSSDGMSFSGLPSGPACGGFGL